ncbi:MAG: retropepsin-like aspartic protease [Chitinophagales bacterium]
MKNLLLVAIAFGMQNWVLAQNDDIVFRDGKHMPGRAAFIANCATGIRSNAPSATDSFATATCTCMVKQFGITFTYSEFLDQLANLPVLMSDSNSSLFKNIQECFAPEVVAAMKSQSGRQTIQEAGSDDNMREIYNNQELRSSVVKTCREALRARHMDTASNHTDLCSCMWDQIKERNVPLKQLAEIADPNSVLLNDLMQACYQDKGKAGSGNEDVVGGAAKISIPLLRLSKVFRVKINLAGTDRLFVLDSGAEDVFVNEKLERQLLEKKLLLPTDAMTSRAYTLADGRTVQLRRYLMNGFKVGDYTVNRLTIAVSEDPNALFLLGKSFLNKFKSWSIDNEKDELILVK